MSDVFRRKYSPVKSEEGRTVDTIFKGTLRAATVLGRDDKFNKPLHTIHVYTNIKDQNIYTIDPAGVRSIVEYNTTLVNEKKGVYIVRRFSTCRKVNGDLFDEVHEEYVTKLDETLIKDSQLHNIVNKNTNNYLDVVRDVIFIPYDDLLYNRKVIDTNTKLMFTVYNECILYPDDDNTVKLDNEFICTVHVNNSKNKMYYINVLGTVLKIPASEAVGEECCKLTYMLAGKVRLKIIHIEDFNSNGVYLTKEEADSHGDLSANATLNKYKHDIEVHDNSIETMKLKQKHAQIDHENTVKEKELDRNLNELLYKYKYAAAISKNNSDKYGNILKTGKIFKDVGDVILGTIKIIL